MLGDLAVSLGIAGREGALTSKEQDVRETPSRAYLRTLLCAIHGWLSAVPRLSVGIGIWSDLAGLAVIGANQQSIVDFDSG